MKDLRIAARSLSRRPSFSLGVLLTLGLGIGATTTIYSVVDGVIIRPLPYGDPSRLVAVGAILPTADPLDRVTGLQELAPMSTLNFASFRERTRSFEKMGALQSGQLLVSVEGESQDFVGTASITADAMEILDAAPALGRTFLPEEYNAPHDGVSMITYGYWQRRYGGDPSILGQPLETAGSAARSIVVGVLSRGFRPPEAFFPSNEIPEIYTPMPTVFPDLPSGARYFSLGVLHVLGRLNRGTSVEQARVEAKKSD